MLVILGEANDLSEKESRSHTLSLHGSYCTGDMAKVNSFDSLVVKQLI